MKWRGRRASSNVEDARGRRAAAGTAGLGMLVDLVGRRFGVKGIRALLVVGFVGWQMGLLDPALMTDGTAPMQQADVDVSPEEQTRYEFVRVVLADTEDIWGREFARADLQYLEPSLVVYRDRYPTDCGMGDARMGPFYCPADRRIYIDLGFYDALAQQFEAPGDFAQAYVIAHEFGHHVQNVLGILPEVNQEMRNNPGSANALSVKLELQADCFAGVWAHSAYTRNLLEDGDLEEGLTAASAVGDDSIQGAGGGRVRPETFTHGTSEQRKQWFLKGFQDGSVESCNTFAS
jgi:predicted metalloprotease